MNVRPHTWLDWVIVLAAVGFLLTQGAKLKGEAMQTTELPEIPYIVSNGVDSEGVPIIETVTGSELIDRARRQAELERKADLWEQHGWRAEVHLVMLTIEERGKRVNAVEDTEYLARAFVRTARELKLPLKLLVAIAETESHFDQSAIGSQGELSLMQILPLVGRPMTQIKSDPSFAIEWAGKNLIAPAYHDGGIEKALMVYNGGVLYVKKVVSLMAENYQKGLWNVVPE